MKINVDNALQTTSRFLKWWGLQLQEAATDLIGILAARRRRAFTAYWNAAQLLIVDENGPEQRTVVEISGSYWPESIPPEIKLAMQQSNRVRLLVSPKMAFVRQLQVPVAVLPHLNAAIALQLPKLLPLDAADLLTDSAVAAQDSTSNVATVDLVALKKADIDPILGRLRAWGLQIVGTHLGDAAERARRFSFLSNGAFRRTLKLQTADRALMAAAATLAVACASVAVAEAYRSQASLERAKAAVLEPAAAASAHRRDLLARLEPLRALARLEAVPPVTALLAELTMLIPQNTYLTTLELQHGQVRLVGVSPNSGNVVKLLSSSKLLNDVALRSSMSLGIGTGLDRFELTAELKGAP